MNDNAKKWIEALRSEKYLPTSIHAEVYCGDLLHGRRYNCFGIACLVAMENGVPLDRKEFQSRAGSFIYTYDGANGWAPDRVKKWLNLKDVFGRFNRENNRKIEYYNDDRYNNLFCWNMNGKSFKEISNLIEKEPDGLFLD